jgi:hypothetical protein
MSAADDIAGDSISPCTRSNLRRNYKSLLSHHEKLGRVGPAGLLLVFAVAAIVFRADWENAAQPNETLLYTARPVLLSPAVSVIGDLEVLHPTGSLNEALRSGRLDVRGWAASARDDVQIRGEEFLLDGKPIQPLVISPDYRLDLAREFDRLELYGSGWSATLPIDRNSLPRILELRVITGFGKQYTLKQVALR